MSDLGCISSGFKGQKSMPIKVKSANGKPTSIAVRTIKPFWREYIAP